MIQIKQAPLVLPFSLPTHLQAKGEVGGAEQAETENGALAGADLLLGEALEQVVAQMAHAVDEVEDEGEAEADLDEALDGKGEGGEAGDQALGLDVEAGERRDQVGEEVGVGGAGERAAGDAGPGRGGEPRLRALVDAQMGGDGTQQTLLGEDVLALGRRQVGGLEGTRQRSGGVSFATGLVVDGNGFGIRLRGRLVGRVVCCGRAYRAWVVEMRAAWARRGMFWLKAAKRGAQKTLAMHSPCRGIPIGDRELRVQGGAGQAEHVRAYSEMCLPLRMAATPTRWAIMVAGLSTRTR